MIKNKESKMSESLTLKTPLKHISPRTANQSTFIEAMENHDMVFGLGPAGTGKTYLAVARAVAQMQAKKVDKIISSNQKLIEKNQQNLELKNNYILLIS